MRVENEYKLKIPDQIADSVWTYLTTKYNNENLFLKEYDPAFNTKVAEDWFVDQYYDNKEMQLLALQYGVRHRTRHVLTDSTDRKHGRQLMQVKINGIDDNGLNRAEYKYEIKYNGKPKSHFDIHPFFNKINADQRSQIGETLSQYGIDPFSLFPTVRVDQLRKRVYISLGADAFATLTLDFCTANYAGKAKSFVEMEMELNEINYTEADSTTRAKMEEINASFKNDLIATFPSIVQDQTPKYNKGFMALGLKDYSYRPLLGMTDTSISLIVLVILGLFVIFYHWKTKKEIAQNNARQTVFQKSKKTEEISTLV